MKSIVVSLAALATLAAASASAADLPYRYPAPAPYAPPPLFTWTGIYVGANAGYSLGTYTARSRSLFGDADGGVVGGTAGYNFQSGQLVVGVEGDIDYADVTARQRSSIVPIIGKSRLNSFGTIRARVGYAIDRALFYGTAGYAGGNIDSTLGDGLKHRTFTDSQYHNGYAIGAGIEYALTPRWSAKAEYLYTRYEDNQTFSPPDTTKVGLGVSTIRGGVNYHF